MMGRGVQQQVSRTAWEGDRFVIMTVHFFPNPATGRLHAVETRLAFSAPIGVRGATVGISSHWGTAKNVAIAGFVAHRRRER